MMENNDMITQLNDWIPKLSTKAKMLEYTHNIYVSYYEKLRYSSIILNVILVMLVAIFNKYSIPVLSIILQILTSFGTLMAFFEKTMKLEEKISTYKQYYKQYEALQFEIQSKLPIINKKVGDLNDFYNKMRQDINAMLKKTPSIPNNMMKQYTDALNKNLNTAIPNIINQIVLPKEDDINVKVNVDNYSDEKLEQLLFFDDINNNRCKKTILTKLQTYKNKNKNKNNLK